MKNKIIMFFWDYCDHHAGFNARRFKIAALILSFLGCDYWINSIDYRG